MNDVPLTPPTYRQPALLEHGKHGRIVCKHIGHEGRYVCVLSDACEMPQQQGGDAASAIRLCDYKSKLGAFRLLPFVCVCGIAAITNDDLLAVCLRDCRHQGDDLAEIHIGNLLELNIRQILLRTEEAAVDRLTIESPERVK